jgi:FAD/FMN-containing dehydrogenase/Fe-S oxidoreductase
MIDPKRKIPYNYTSADDDQIIKHLFGSDLLKVIKKLDSQKDTGRSARLLYRFMGDLFIIQRNPFLFQELVEHPCQRKRLFSEFKNDLATIENNARQKDVLKVLKHCKKELYRLSKKIATLHADQNRILRHLSPVIGKTNIYFDPFNITAHTTDATDWRLYTPVAVLRPDKESQVSGLVKRIKKLGFQIIPRGAGTGLTGGATPLTPTCIMINTEKLNRISDIEIETDDQGNDYATITLEAGVITQDAIDAAKHRGFIFATDPTSSWACTIGGNLSENAGGKTAVLYGTAIDNVLSYHITMPDAVSYTVKRRSHPLRKTLSRDTVVFDVYHQDGQLIRTITLRGDQLRKKGLGKDVTNKTLNGLLGIQKEGCDGIITSAKFILYPEFQFKKTFCIEFFGNDMTQAGQVIAAISRAFSRASSNRGPFLMALEHFDEEYIKAIKYKTKTSVGTRLIAVLLVDMVSNDQNLLQTGVNTLETLLEPYDKTGLSIARDRHEAERYWQDRKRLGAIAAHTNAFKLNEDVVLPIDSLASFAKFIDQYNIEEKKFNQTRIIQNIIEYLDTAIPLSDPELLQKRVGQAKDLAYRTRKKLEIASRDALEACIHSKNFFREIIDNLHGYTFIIENVTRVYEETKARLIVIATHMHAGDGNVHVNIPVFSNDRQMMERANFTADKIMKKAVQLNGVVSGEHGIGITKIKHLDQHRLNKFINYRKGVDPDGLMNPDKLMDPDIIEKVFTPSFNLLELEARILKHGSLSELAMNIANCVRCGRCKPRCPMFFPGKNMFFHPRNKNLSIGALIEALLYITQRTQSTGFKVLKNIEQIADHCTICHKCFEKCPVNIDFGEISIQLRQILQNMGFKHTSIATRATLAYLSSKNKFLNPVLRTSLLGIGTRLQRTATNLLSPLKKIKKLSQKDWYQLLQSPVTKPGTKTVRAFLPGTNKNQAVILEPQETIQSTVFYFPGCGSERVFSRISMACIFLLLETCNRVILPPPYMCCGYPFLVNARKKEHDRIMLENIIILTQIREMFEDLTFDACIVTCGTCMESLYEIDTPRIFDCCIQDISEFILNRDQTIELTGNYLYHAPCHDSLKDNALTLLKPHCRDNEIQKVPYCCSEAGTMAISRPDIANAMLERKKRAVKKEIKNKTFQILTNCPSCIQGLGRHRRPKLKVTHLAEELALLKGGENWERKLKILLAQNKVVTF